MARYVIYWKLCFQHIKIRSNCVGRLFWTWFSSHTTLQNPQNKRKMCQCFINYVFSYLQVFGNAPPNTMTEKFSDLLQFTTQVSRLMVTEIRRRASNKSTGIFTVASKNWFVWMNRQFCKSPIKIKWKTDLVLSTLSIKFIYPFPFPFLESHSFPGFSIFNSRVVLLRATLPGPLPIPP